MERGANAKRQAAILRVEFRARRWQALLSWGDAGLTVSHSLRLLCASPEPLEMTFALHVVSSAPVD
jgi:hypothetical protein